MNVSLLRAVMCVLAAVAASSVFPEEPALALGEVAENIQCRNAPGQSWDLYLPSSYDPSTKWPILYCLDARGRGRVPLERFREAAERYGWIIASSNNSASDGPVQVIADALKAMWIDSRVRLSVDTSRIYVAGFSGTARFATMSDRLIGSVRGVIGAGAGAPYDAPVRESLPFSYYVTVGLRDFNYYEIRKLEETLAERKARFHIAYFDGRHDWPPSSVATEAVEWMQLEAMRDGTIPLGRTFADDLIQRRIESGDRLSVAGRLSDALREYESIVRDFEGLGLDVTAVGSRAEELAKDPRVSDAVAADQERDARDLRAIDDAAKKLSAAVARGTRPPTPERLVRQLGIERLLDRSTDAGNPRDAESALRILATLGVQTSFYMPQALIARDDYDHAILLLQVATRIQPGSPQPWYQLAVAHSKSGRANDALAALREAIALGVRDAGAVRADPNLAALRESEGFERVLAGIPPK